MLPVQLPPSYRYTKTRNDIVSQLDPGRRNVVEFRHASWWNEDVYAAFRKAGLDVVPATDTSLGPPHVDSLLDLLPDVGALSWTTSAIKEIIGLFIYRVRGWA